MFWFKKPSTLCDMVTGMTILVLMMVFQTKTHLN